MAPFDQFLIHASAIRPEHVTLADHQPTLRSLVDTIEDPYYSHSHPKHRNSYSPRFDVRESDFSFFLEGEFPGIAGKEDIMIEKLGRRTLLIQTTDRRFDVNKEWNLRGSEDVTNDGVEGQQQQRTKGLNIIKSGGHDGTGGVEIRHDSGEEKLERDENGLRVRLAERRVGYLQRSFTFPSAVDIDSLKARLRNGLLVMMVPKVNGTKDDSTRIQIED